MSAKIIPPRPDLDQYRKQAKDLLKAHVQGALDALERLRSHHARFAKRDLAEIRATQIRLADAQFVIAREHGFKNWPDFQQHVRTTTAAVESIAFPERISVDGADLALRVHGWKDAKALVQFIAAGDVDHDDPGLALMSERLASAGICSVVSELLTEDEWVEDAINEALRFDIQLLGKRAAGVTAWIASQSTLANLPMGYVGGGTGAAAAVLATLQHPARIRALVSNAGRPDLAGPWIGRIDVPMLAVIGGEASVALGFTRSVMQVIPDRIPHEIRILDSATHPFSGESATRAAALVGEWFERYLISPSAT